MNRNYVIFYIVALVTSLFGAGVTSCNNHSDYNYDYEYSYSSTAITNFSLVANSKILNNLDSVFFTIDLNKGEIYNAQPLPYGTDISRMLVNIETDNTSSTEIIFKTEAGNDTTITYQSNDSEAAVSNVDSINFANGPVYIHVASYDGTAGRNYSVTINVYDQKVDSIFWDKVSDKIPSALSNPKKQKAVEAGERFYILTNSSSDYSIAYTDNPYDESSWEMRTIQFDGFTPAIDSFTGTSDGKLYILSNDGQLYLSEDEAESWTSCDVAMNYIYGAYIDKIVGSFIDGTTAYTRLYPDTEEPIAVPTDFPVSGTSEMVCQSVRWGVNPQGYIVGGKKLDGSLSGDTWGFDGRQWARINTGSLEEAEGRTLFRYIFSETDSTTWRTTRRPVLVTTGGRLADNTMVSDMYYSNDMGLHWFRADDLKQFPEKIKQRHSASVIVANHKMTSRAITPVTDWDTPYIYLIGGYDIYGTFLPDVWRGVLGYLTIKPLQ